MFNYLILRIIPICLVTFRVNDRYRDFEQWIDSHTYIYIYGEGKKESEE